MSIAGRINFLFILSGLFLISMAASYVAQREYEVILDDLVGKALARTQNRPELQVYFYRQDNPGLDQILSDFQDTDAIRERAITQAKARIALSERNFDDFTEDELEVIVQDEEGKVKGNLKQSAVVAALIVLGLS